MWCLRHAGALRGFAGLCARVRACAGAAESLHTYIHIYVYIRIYPKTYIYGTPCHTQVRPAARFQPRVARRLPWWLGLRSAPATEAPWPARRRRQGLVSTPPLEGKPVTHTEKDLAMRDRTYV